MTDENLDRPFWFTPPWSPRPTVNLFKYNFRSELSFAYYILTERSKIHHVLFPCALAHFRQRFPAHKPLPLSLDLSSQSGDISGVGARGLRLAWGSSKGSVLVLSGSTCCVVYSSRFPSSMRRLVPTCGLAWHSLWTPCVGDRCGTLTA